MSARRERVRQRYLRPLDERAKSTARGVHHVAFICRDVEATVRFYHELHGFPLVEMVENRDYRGSKHRQHSRARAALDEASVSYTGPDCGVEESLYLRDPNALPLELHREELGQSEGTRLV